MIVQPQHVNHSTTTANPMVTQAEEKSLAYLPPPETKRWVISRKTVVVDAVKRGLISLADVCARYGLSEEEVHSWMRLLEKGGSRALRVTKLQQYRPRKQTLDASKARKKG